MSGRAPRPIRGKAEVQIDPVAWARVYGLDEGDREAIALDVQEWAHNLLVQAAEQSGVLVGESSAWASL